MDKINVKLIRTARKYAEALYDIANNQGIAENVSADLNLIAETFEESKALRDFTENPVISQSDKKDAIRQLFENRVSQATMNFLYLLADNSRFDAVFSIKEEFEELKNKNTGVLTAKATTAVVMKDELKEKLKSKLEQKFSKEIKLEYEVTPEIIGGLIVDVDGKTIDSSVLTKIKNIKKQLI